jgi:hypothetical protein
MTANPSPQPIISDACALLGMLERLLHPTGRSIRLFPSEIIELLNQARMLRESIRLYGDEARAMAAHAPGGCAPAAPGSLVRSVSQSGHP